MKVASSRRMANYLSHALGLNRIGMQVSLRSNDMIAKKSPSK